MSLGMHGDLKYGSSRRIGYLHESRHICIEHRLLNAGLQNAFTPSCTEVVVMLSGRAHVSRAANGQTHRVTARPGMSWVVPVGTDVSRIEITGSMESLHLYLPPTLMERRRLASYEIDPGETRLAYAGGVTDGMLFQLGSAFRSLLGRERRAVDRLLIDGLRLALAAHLLGTYSAGLWPPRKAPPLGEKRLKRVLAFIEARLASDISLNDLAAEARLSPFHFSRLFQESTGFTPHRYVTERRVHLARERLTGSDASLVDIALDTGLGSQSNFTRVFRKATGLTPGQYRKLHLR